VSSSFASVDADFGDFEGVDGGSTFFLWRTSAILELVVEREGGGNWRE
jgi:hypothetical protein